MSWFAHCYAAEPGRVLDVVLRVAGPRTRVGDRDVPFLRGTADRRTTRPEHALRCTGAAARGV